MPVSIDLIVLGCLGLFFMIGWSRGFLKSIMGPIALIIGGIASYIYYLTTGQMIISLVIGIIGPIVLQLLLSLAINMWDKARGEEKPSISFGRFMGGAFNVFWCGTILVLTIILLAVLPIKHKGYQQLRNAVRASQTYHLVNSLSGNRLTSASKELTDVSRFFGDTKRIENLQHTSEYKRLMNNKKIQAVFSDEDLTKRLQSGNYVEALKDPKLQAIFQDKEVIKLIMDMNKKILEGTKK